MDPSEIVKRIENNANEIDTKNPLRLRKTTTRKSANFPMTRNFRFFVLIKCTQIEYVISDSGEAGFSASSCVLFIDSVN